MTAPPDLGSSTKAPSSLRFSLRGRRQEPPPSLRFASGHLPHCVGEGTWWLRVSADLTSHIRRLSVAPQQSRCLLQVASYLRHQSVDVIERALVAEAVAKLDFDDLSAYVLIEVEDMYLYVLL